MDKLEEMKAKFKDKTAGGLEFVILEVYTDSMQVVVKSRDSLSSINRWVLCLYDLGGASFGTTSNLVPIKPVIDYSKLPVDVLCETSSKTGGKLRRYSDGRGNFFTVGKDSGSVENKDHSITLGGVKIVDNPIRANFNSQVDNIPDNVNIKVWLADGQVYLTRCNKGLRDWPNIIYYQILGES